jgi:hypothetical protein
MCLPTDKTGETRVHRYPKPKKKFRPTEEERAKARAKAAARSKMSKTERLLDDARNHPSPTCHDRRQLNLLDYIRQQAFAKLDREIGKALD